MKDGDKLYGRTLHEKVLCGFCMINNEGFMHFFSHIKNISLQFKKVLSQYETSAKISQSGTQNVLSIFKYKI